MSLAINIEVLSSDTFERSIQCRKHNINLVLISLKLWYYWWFYSYTKPSFDFTAQSAKFDLFAKLERLVGSQRIESHKHLLSWVIKKWRKVAGNPEIKTEGQSKGVLDKGASNTSGCEDANTDPESEKKRLAAERRKKIMAQMALAQKNFMKER